MDTQKICDALVAREHMGSTGIGAGIAVPHARMDGLKDIFALFARLDQPIDFAAVDGRPVDVIVLLLIPPDAGSRHLAALACVSRQLRRPGMAERLRRAKDAGELYALLTGAPA
jgi:PTS system nitrogen regulatory IIA component